MTTPTTVPPPEPIARIPSLRRLPYHWLALATAAIAGFMTPLESNLVIVSLPSLARTFAVPASHVVWVMVATTLVTVGLALPVASLSERWGRRRLFRFGFWIFTLGAIVAFVAPSIEALIAARALQGIGIGLFASTRNAIAVESMAASRRGFALGVILAAVGLGGATAPFLAGWLLDTFDWRAIFAAEATLGLVAAVASMAVLTPESGAQRHTRPFDFIGGVLIFSGVAGMLIAGNRLPSWGADSPLVIGLGGGGMILAALFVWRQLRATNPILDLSIFRIRAFSIPTGTLILHMMSFSTAVILVPFYLEGALGLAPRQASMVFAAAAFCLFLGSLVGGALYERLGPWRIAVASLGVALIGFGGLTALTASTDLFLVILVLALVGLAEGVFQSTTAAAQVAAVPRERLATASALFMTGIMLPISAGLTLGGTLLSARLPVHEASLGVGAAAVSAAYHEVALVGLGFAAAAFLAYAFLGRGRTIAGRQGG